MSSSSSGRFRATQCGSGSHHSKHKSKDGKGNSAQKQPRQEPSSTSKSETSNPSHISFLFVVNELEIDYERHSIKDQWLNQLPPTHPTAYVNEYPGTVFRYRQGNITVAANYVWSRAAMGQEGRIARVSEYGAIDWQPEPYKTESIFACSSHLPIITLRSDCSLGSSIRNPCGNAQLPGSDQYAWSLLHFGHYDGVSHVNSRSQGATYVAGRSPSWIPSLVPRAFENTYRLNPTRSRGLSGDLPVVIGLMAFHSSKGHASSVFLNGWWHRGQWRGPADAPVRGYPEGPDCNPRGFVIQISPDFTEDDIASQQMGFDPTDEITARLEHLECNGILVEG